MDAKFFAAFDIVFFLFFFFVQIHECFTHAKSQKILYEIKYFLSVMLYTLKFDFLTRKNFKLILKINTTH